jgi:peroxiredoxin
VHPVNLHGTYEDPEVKATYTETATFTLPVDTPATALVPDYMPYMAGYIRARDILRDRSRTRAHYYRHERNDLPRAAGLYREMLRLRDEYAREQGQPVMDPDTWLELGEVLQAMGRLEEARAAFEQALRESIYPGYPRDEARQKLEAVKAALTTSPGHPAPAFTATDLDGRPQSPARYRGQVLLIDFWAPWNKANVAEIPRLKALYSRYRADGFTILSVGITMDIAAEKGRQTVEQHQPPWPQVFDLRSRENQYTGQIARLYGYSNYVTPLPMRFLVDRQGIIRHTGLSGPALEKAVAELVAARP